MQKDELNLVIAGEAGQGLVTIGQLLAKALVRTGRHIHVTQSYHSRIRGGSNSFAVRAAAFPVAAPTEKIDLLLALNHESLELHAPDLNDGGLILGLPDAAGPSDSLLAIPFDDLAETRFHNTVGLGAMAALIGLERRVLDHLLQQGLAKHPEMIEPNLAALAKSMDWAAERKEDFPDLAVGDGVGRLMINGNEAIALGAISAGVKVCAFYPMTPSTSMALNLAARAERMGLVVEQVEDEIAAVNLAIGASFAGAPSLVPTSGGGLALMVEGISLAGMTETPLVVAVAQRPGPATGLPTRTEQGDLEMVLHAGHGEFPRAVYAPGSPEQCFHLTRAAFEQAQRWQTPCFLLTDQYLADSLRAVEPSEMQGSEACGLWQGPSDDEPGYERYALMENGISPRRLPGMGQALVVADSDEHTPDGHITEDLAVRKLMVDKRLRKQQGMAAQARPPDYLGPDEAELLLVCWGSTLGPAAEAAALLRAEGVTAAVLHFSQVWPLVPERFLPRLEKARQAVMVEGNAQGQMARLVRRESGFLFENKVLRYDGLPFTPGYILRALKA